MLKPLYKSKTIPTRLDMSVSFHHELLKKFWSVSRHPSSHPGHWRRLYPVIPNYFFKMLSWPVAGLCLVPTLPRTGGVISYIVKESQMRVFPVRIQCDFCFHTASSSTVALNFTASPPLFERRCLRFLPTKIDTQDRCI